MVVSVTIRTDNVAQADLVAMRHGLAITERTDHDGGWSTLVLDRTGFEETPTP